MTGDTHALLERAVEALERIAGAMAGAAPVVNNTLRFAIRRDMQNGMSLRGCADKHGVGVGVVRGVVARAALSNTQDQEQG